MTTYWKVWTHDWCSPLQGGTPAVTGPLPFALPTVRLDAGSAECAAGWHCTRDPAVALRIAGLWPDGRPSRLTLVEPAADMIHRGDKSRASSLTVLREATAEELEAALRVLSAPFGDRAEEMALEQGRWRLALARPGRDHAVIRAGLQRALTARGLVDWELREFGDAWAARAARDARAAWDAWDARAAWGAWAAWEARAARVAWDARDAWAALIHYCAARKGWINAHPAQYTIGIREAYMAGLGIVVPVGERTLGWAMDTAARLVPGQEERTP